MSESLKTIHNGIPIEYIEQEAVFCFELRGREKKVESLKKAKELIDAPAPKDKKPFTKVKAWYSDYGSELEPIEITSLAEGSNLESPGTYCWIMNGKSRRKVRCSIVYLTSPENDALVENYNRLKEEIAELAKKKAAVLAKMKPFVAPKE